MMKISKSRFTSKTIIKHTSKKVWYDYTVRARVIGGRGRITKAVHNHSWVDYTCNY